jgi:AcrR family transcriptional regulator
MDEIAKEANLTRQAVYLHFGTKRGLLLALVEHIDSSRDVYERVETIWSAADALNALQVAVQVAAHTNAEVCRIGLALDAARRWDSDFDAAWRNRMGRRLARYRRLARWLHRDGILGAGWTIREAAVFLWTSTSIATFDLIVHDMGLTTKRYERLLLSMLRATLQAPLVEHLEQP